MSYHYPILIIISPLIFGILGLLTKKYLALGGVGISLSLTLSLILTGKTITYSLGGWPPPLGITLVTDGLALFFSLIVTFVELLVMIYSLPSYNRTYYFLLALSTTAMLGVIFTGDIFNLYVFYELLSLAVYLLIAYPKTGEALKAGLNYLFISSIGLSFFLLSVGILYGIGGTLSILHLKEEITGLYQGNPQMVILAFSLMTIAFGIKAAAFPLHTWLPDAHSLAPTPVSALLSGVVIKISIYAFIRIYSVFDLRIGPIVMYMGIVTLIFGAAMALVQGDIKRLLSYSSIAQIGVILIGLGIGGYFGMRAALYHLLNHVLMKGCLFLSAGMIISHTGSREIESFKGLSKRPALVIPFVIASLSIVGIPLSNGFITKYYTVLAAVEADRSGAAVAVLISTIVAVVYYLRVIQMFFAKSSYSYNNKQSLLESVPTYLLAFLCLLLGWVPSLGLYLVEMAINSLGIGT
jgi:multicomponent Na+:H+ antiporter subunit D